MTVIPHTTALDYQAPAAAAAAHDAHAHHEVGFVKKYIFSTDHKVIGIQFLLIGLTFMVIGGLEAMLVRWQLAWPNEPVPILSQYMVATGVWNAGPNGELPGMPPDF